MSTTILPHQAIVLAAGQGVRMRSEKPKVLHQVCGQSLLERVLRALAAVQPRRVIVVVGHGEAEVREELKRLSGEPGLSELTIDAVIQAERKGTGHAVMTALPALSSETDKVLIVPGDVPLLNGEVLQSLLERARDSASELTFLTCSLPDASGFGRVVRDESQNVKAIVEHRDCSEAELRLDEINSSIYLAGRGFLSEALRGLRCDNAQGEFYLTDIVSSAVTLGLNVEAVKVDDYLSLRGANSRAELSELETIRRRQINRCLMLDGVGLENPEAVYVDDGVTVGPDAYLGAGTRLLGHTTLGSRVIVEGDSRITDSEIAEGARIKFGSVIESSEVGAECQVGPFAHLRPGSILRVGAKVGNFVETKKAELGPGVKASHLSYIGDACVGEGTNIGAGTITCNYDGKEKHQTVIESGCFVGSNSCLVAPVTVGSGAYIGAGSTINKDVPAGSLAVARGKQTNLSGWVERKAGKKEK